MSFGHRFKSASLFWLEPSLLAEIDTGPSPPRARWAMASGRTVDETHA